MFLLSTLSGFAHAIPFTTLVTLLTLILFAPWASATVYVTSNGSFPDDISSGCSAALTADLNCSSTITKLRNGLYYPASALASLCTVDCSTALAGYESDVTTACGSETYDSQTSEGDVPLYVVPQMLRYYYNYSCLADASSGEYCNVLAAEAIGILADQSNMDSIDGGGSLNCSDCDLKKLQFLAGAAYYNDDGVESMYSSLTSSCSATDYPLATSTLGFTGTSTATSTLSTASATCTGTTYTIQDGDTCESISKSQGVATMRLLIDNSLPAYCAAFPTNGSLCIEHTCSTYTVQANDTCTDIASAHGLNYAQVLAWNPQLNLICSNINKTVGLEICVSSPGPAYTPVASASTTATASSASTAAAVPTNAANGSVSSCGEWYEAVPGDYCNLIILRVGISLADFLVLNPEVNSNCTNLYAYESYCVEPVGDISNYPGAAGYESAAASFTTTPASLLPTATYIPALYSAPNVTYADGTRTDCAEYLNGSLYNLFDLSNSSYVSSCDLALVRYSITLDELTLWNPSLDGTSVSNCSFVDGLSYCAAWSNDVPTPTYSTFPSVATATTTVNCTQYTFADDVTCDDILQAWNITLAYFYTLNPSIGADCSGMLQLTYYCVNTTDAVTVTSLPAASSATATSASTVSPPGPTMSGIPATCDAYYVVQSGDSCASVEAAYNITDAEFHAWNPSVSTDCETNFWSGEAYCVGVSSSGASSATTTTAAPTSTSSSTKTATTSTTATTETSVTAPGPTMSGIPASCNAYYVVQSGDSCTSVETAYGITDAEFHAWNPAVSSDCTTNFWTGEAYCVGVSSSGTTSSISSSRSSTKTTTATATTTSVTPPGPTMTGTAANCNAYYVVQSGDSCSSVETAYGITDTEFHTWNTAVSADCTTNFWAGEAYCVGVSS